MKNRNLIFISGIMLVLMFLGFSFVLYNNLKSDIIRNEHARIEKEMPYLMKFIDSGINYVLHCGIDDCCAKRVDLNHNVADSCLIRDFMIDNHFTILLSDTSIIVKQDMECMCLPLDYFYNKISLINADHVKYVILGYGSHADLPPDISRRIEIFNKLGYEYGYFETGEYLVNYRNSFNDYSNGFILVVIKPIAVVLKQFNDFAVLLFVLVFVMIALIGIFLIFYIDANARLIKREEKTKRERELLRINQLIGIERLSESIIHNINNPLTSAKGFLQLLLNDEPEIAVKYRIKNILSNLDQINAQASAVLNKTRRDLSEEKLRFSLNKLIADELDFHKNLMTQFNITLITSLNPEIPMIMGIFSDYTTIFDNLIDNAVDAMYDSENRVLTVKTEVDDKFIYVKVEDTGKGIDEHIRNSIFDLYFTTKPLSRNEKNEPVGTGIGLYSVKQAIERNNLNIHIDSVMGKGTVFTISIPL